MNKETRHRLHLLIAGLYYSCDQLTTERMGEPGEEARELLKEARECLLDAVSKINEAIEQDDEPSTTAKRTSKKKAQPEEVAEEPP